VRAQSAELERERERQRLGRIIFTTIHGIAAGLQTAG